MSEEQLKAFLEAVKADTTLQQKLEGVTDPDAIVAVANEADFSISADELKNAIESVELSDEELKGAAGGGSRTFGGKVGSFIRGWSLWGGGAGRVVWLKEKARLRGES